MHRLIVLGLFLSVSIAPSVVAWEFEWTATGGPWLIEDYSIQQIPLDGEYVQNASEVELLIEGLSHTCPMDLNIFLLDPFGGGIEIIDDTGDQIPISGVTITFSDDGIPLPGDNEIMNGADYVPLAPGTFGQYDGEINAGTWYLLVLDDAPNHSGDFYSFTLRGIPEPMTLSLLALGALVALRRMRP